MFRRRALRPATRAWARLGGYAAQLPFDDFHECYSRVADAVRRPRGSGETDILLRKPGEIERRRDDPGYIDRDVAREGIVVYPFAPGRQTPHVSATLQNHVRERPPHASITGLLERVLSDAMGPLRMLSLDDRVRSHAAELGMELCP